MSFKFSTSWICTWGLIVGVGCSSSHPDKIVVGHFGSLTGNEATFGVATDEGIRLAFDEINAQGGIKGKQLLLITRDDQGKPDEAAAVVTRLIVQDHVIALLGEVASSRSLAAAPIAQKRKVPMVTPSSTNPKVTQVGNFIFRTCFIDPFQGAVMAKFAAENLHLKHVAILRDLRSDYSVGLADVFAKKFPELGGEIVKDLTYQSQDVDFKGQLTQLKSMQVDGIYVPGYYTEVGLIARQAKELGIKVPLMGGDGWDSPKLTEIGQDAIQGGYFSNHYSAESTDPASVAFVKKFQDRYHKVPDGLSSVAYDAAMILAHAMQETKDLNRESLRDQLALIKDFQGATGKITIDENRNATKSAVVVKVVGTSNKYVTTVNP